MKVLDEFWEWIKLIIKFWGKKEIFQKDIGNKIPIREDLEYVWIY